MKKAIDYVGFDENIWKRVNHPDREFGPNIYELMKKRWKMMSQYDIMIE